MIRFLEIDERQNWSWGYITDHMTMILYRSHNHDITIVIFLRYKLHWVCKMCEKNSCLYLDKILSNLVGDWVEETKKTI